ncbi:MAG: ferredoxin [Patescibacteria group bacterium]|nr:ferredoxin [Patescibacteria group bacterium]
MKVKIDKEKCIGCGSCEAVCPDFFKMDDENKAYFKENKEGDRDCIKEAADICPLQAIEVEE